jgi:kynureninase
MKEDHMDVKCVLPGGIAGIFVHERHATNFDRNRLAGWWGHDKATRFDMSNGK